MPTLLQRIDRDATLAQASAKEPTAVAKICRVSLAENAKIPVELSWLRGLGAKKELLILRPGKALDLPLDRCHIWFGPFDRFAEYEEEINRPIPNEKVIGVLRDHIATESARILFQWGYPYKGRGYHPDMTPIGPHRFPDVTIQTLNAEGENGDPIRCHEVYGIGEFDETEFSTMETEDQIRQRYETQLRERESQVEEMRREVAKLTGLVQGVVIATDPKHKEAKTKETVPA
jgi:hypothetical protein